MNKETTSVFVALFALSHSLSEEHMKRQHAGNMESRNKRGTKKLIDKKASMLLFHSIQFNFITLAQIQSYSNTFCHNLKFKIFRTSIFLPVRPTGYCPIFFSLAATRLRSCSLNGLCYFIISGCCSTELICDDVMLL